MKSSVISTKPGMKMGTGPITVLGGGQGRMQSGAPSPSGIETKLVSESDYVEVEEKKTDRLRVSAEVDSLNLQHGPGSQPGLMTPKSSVPLSMAFRRATLANGFSGLQLVGGRSKIDQTYKLRVTFTSTVTPTVGGVVGQIWVANPANVPFTEWTTFAALFDEVKLVSLVVDWWIYDPLAVTTGPALAVTGSFLSYTTGVTSVAQLANAGNSRLVNTVNTTKSTHRVSLVGKALNWASTASPAPGPYAGCPGSVQLYGTGFTPSVGVGSEMAVLTLLLRGRL